MCGIAGVIDWSGERPPDLNLLRRMLGILRHRGPDEFGGYVDRRAAIGCARLSIVDLCTGQQPIANEDGSLWIVFNGEVYNHPELRSELVRAGHRFTTRSDTEVILHLYEEWGPDCLNRLNRQFAIAIWAPEPGRLFLARDRLGVRPLFYAQTPGGIAFGSEVKALLLHPQVDARLDAHALAQTFTFWAPLTPRSAFEGVFELPPGHWMTVDGRGRTISRYWQLTFPAAGAEEHLPADTAAEILSALLSDATRLRLRADVTVGSYLSGGLDSTLIAALSRQHIPTTLRTFSIGFEQPAFDERNYQEIASAFLGTDHRQTECSDADIGTVFPEVVWHAEAPLLRTSPAPMYLLSKLVRDERIKVVLTGEGADEFLGGYNIFKEDKVCRFWARRPESTWRPLLLRRLYPYVADLTQESDAYRAAFFRRGLELIDRPGSSHRRRWSNTAALQRLFTGDLRAELAGYDPVSEFLDTLDGVLDGSSPLAQAQYLEVATFMSPYLLSSQGDRMMAAHSVEGRFPFLDHRVVEFCGRLPPHLKLPGLQEKHILRRVAQGLLPAVVRQRRKQPYRAPIHSAFLNRPPDYVEALLAPDAVRAAGVFEPAAVARLLQKCRNAPRVGERDDMALVGVISTQLLHHRFVTSFSTHPVCEAVLGRLFDQRESVRL